MSTREPTADRATDIKRRRFERDSSQLAVIRRFVRDWYVGHEVPADVVDDFELAVSELATNAAQYGAGSSIEIELAVEPRNVILVVAADTVHASRIGSVESWQIAPPEAVDGRGLGIVAAVMDVVEFSDDSGRAVFRCSRRL